MISKPRINAAVVVFITTLLASSMLLADGFRNPPEGARAIGEFGGQRAFADDANANIHNSANLVDLEQPMVQINTTFGYGRMTFERAGVSDETENPFFALPGFSAAAPFQDGKYAAGLSFYVPFGRSVTWKDTDYFATTPNPYYPGSGYPYSGSMMVADLTPNFAMRLCDSLSIGVGADLYYGTVEQKQFLYGLDAFGIPTGTRSKLTGDGTAVGWNCAVTWKMTEKQRLAATYRSPFTVKYKGDNEYSFGGANYLTSDVDAKIEYPTIIGMAYGIELTDTLRTEVNGEWIDFSQYENLTINDSVSGTTAVPQSLKETWTAGVGVEWDFKPQWTLRSGFMYLKNPTPTDTYSPIGPDEDQGVVSIGLGYENEHHAVDVGYAYGLFDGRDISGSVSSPDGNYDYLVHLLSLSYGYKF